VHPAATNAPLTRLAYGVYAWLILVIAVMPVAAACLLLPGLERRRAIARRGAAAVFRLIGSPIDVHGTRPDVGETAIIVANHGSYLDGVVLTAVLPPQYTFLIKREMVRVPVAGFVLERLGSEFVDRSCPSQRHRSGRRLLDAARQGKGLAVFPEGTFDAEPGLKPFRLGAFRAARLGRLAIIPVVIHGARSKLPASSWLPRPGPLSVEFCERIEAADYADADALMEATRRAMLARMPEPDTAVAGLAPVEG
jgi:1-acyl-sn-glycerol-3-phosphate acyltransferase